MSFFTEFQVSETSVEQFVATASTMMADKSCCIIPFRHCTQMRKNSGKSRKKESDITKDDIEESVSLPTMCQVRGKLMFSLMCVILSREGVHELSPLWTMNCWPPPPGPWIVDPPLPRPRTIDVPPPIPDQVLLTPPPTQAKTVDYISHLPRPSTVNTPSPRQG